MFCFHVAGKGPWVCCCIVQLLSLSLSLSLSQVKSILVRQQSYLTVDCWVSSRKNMEGCKHCSEMSTKSSKVHVHPAFFTSNVCIISTWSIFTLFCLRHQIISFILSLSLSLSLSIWSKVVHTHTHTHTDVPDFFPWLSGCKCMSLALIWYPSDGLGWAGLGCHGWAFSNHLGSQQLLCFIWWSSTGTLVLPEPFALTLWEREGL